MKKFLSLISLLLVFMLVVAVPTVAAEEADDQSEEWVAPEGVQMYYANDISDKAAPVIDGEIKEDEYGKMTVKMTDHLTFANVYPEADYQIDDTRVDQPASESFDFYFAYDDNFYYIAYVDYGAKWEEGSATDTFLKSVSKLSLTNYTSRNNYAVNMGFELDNMTNYVGLNASSRGFDENAWYEFGKLSYSFKNVSDVVSELYMKRYLRDDPSKVISQGDAQTATNPNSTEGQYVAVVEIKLSKSQLIDRISEYQYINYVELPNAMWFNFIGRSYVLKSDLSGTDGVATSYNRYFATDIREKQADYFDWGIEEGSTRQILSSLIVWGDENTVIHNGIEDWEVTESITTEAPQTECVTDEIQQPHDETLENTEAPETETPETEAPAENGCGSVVGFTSIALVATLGACTIFLTKKKED